MKTEMLIKELTANVAPVRPVLHPIVQFALWVVASSFLVAVGVLLIGPRRDLHLAAQESAFAMQVIPMLFLTCFSAAAAFFLGIPDRKKTWTAWGPLLALISWLIIFGLLLTSHGNLHTGAGIKCLRNILVLSTGPAMILLYILKRSVAFESRTMGLFAILSATTLACAGTRFICPNDDPLHFFLWHFASVAALAALGAYFGPIFFKKIKN